MKITRSDDLKLRDLLRQGDPALGHQPLGPRELASMRQEILRKVEARGAAPRLVNWRWVAAAACVGILVVVGWQLKDLSVHPSAASDPAGIPASSIAEDATPQGISPPLTVDAETVPAVPEPAVVVEATGSAPPVVAASSEPGGASPPPRGDVSTENLQARTLRFTTRRGTQIIWILDPELEL